MIVVDEPGPVKLIPVDRFPYGHGNRREFETIAARLGQQLAVTADVIGGPIATMQQASAANVDGEFARTIPAAVAEIGGQLGSQSAVDPARMYVAALESLADLDGAGDGLASAASGANIGLPGGGSTFGTVAWAIAGEGSAATPSRRPGSRPPGEPGDPGDEAPAPVDDQPTEPEPAPPPPPEAEPVPEPAPAFEQPPPAEEDEPLF